MHVARVCRYPVKGLGGEDLPRVHFSEAGIAFDRHFALAHDRVPLEPFGSWTTYEAFLALDGFPSLAGFSARIEETSGEKRLELTSPDARRLTFPLSDDRRMCATSASDDQSVNEWFGTHTHTARLVAAGTGLWDLADSPISLINLASLNRVAESLGLRELDPRRFRANVYLDGLEPWEEFTLVGRTLRIGDAEVEIIRPIERCRAITVDPDHPTNDINVLAALAANFGHSFCGLYARVVKTGSVGVGDPITVTGAPLAAPDTDGSDAGRAATPRMATVLTVAASANDIVSIELEDPTGHLLTARAGQHLRVHHPDTAAPAWRNYTLSRIGGRPRISVHRDPDGRVSPWLHEVKAGGALLISGPFGDVTVTPDDPSPLLVITAGIGITPALAYAADLARTPRPATFLHVARTTSGVAHLDELVDACHRAGARFELFLTGEDAPTHRRGRPDQDALAEIVSNPTATLAVLCGPSRFDRAMREALAAVGVPPDRIKSDPFYSPRTVDFTWREPPSRGPFQVRFEGSEAASGVWEGSGTLLDLADNMGAGIRSSCRAGVCGSCLVKVRGEVAYVVDPLDDTPTGMAYACCAVPTTDLTVVSN
ncbi:MOSC domain-containing protein [Microbacterium sp. Root180]|uniref:MOSC domain-containing protein n=1 Tax=Microbacterium sp. Root180 TaxID=1736483 RepID=UPI0006FED88C|nr:MOSC domain-containing protein [Microbacterium sp. Root180]KRB37218.1 hypothetical protein ASD93_14675 [Microbacterium sp. Root180]